MFALAIYIRDARFLEEEDETAVGGVRGVRAQEAPTRTMMVEIVMKPSSAILAVSWAHITWSMLVSLCLNE